MRKSLLLGLSVLLIGGIVYVNARNDAEQDAARLLDKLAPSGGWENDPTLDPSSETARTQNKPPPGDFLVDLEPGGTWFVGKRGAESELLLPYRPVQIPSPTDDLEAVNENPGFLGADACQSCHQDRHASFVHTAHHRTSAAASRASIAGSFEPGENVLKTDSQGLWFKMVERDQRLFQQVSFYGWKCDVPFDVVTGSSKLGQSYLYWHDDGLYQMNVSYITGTDDWVNSPGYPDGQAIYNRPVTNRCLECHTTWADVRRPPNHYTPNSLILGISCERCHGPGRDHVQYHQSNPDEKTARFITHPASLSRQQQLDICGQCHFGIPKLKDAPYQFRPGDDLMDHYQPPQTNLPGGVHSSNQLVRLSKSPCFNETEMTCTTCHNPHQSERGNRKLFSQRCLQCHQPSHCGMEPTLGQQLSDNCIDCHMPAGATKNMFMNTAQGKVFPSLRDHHIRVDRDLTAAYLKSIGK